MSYRTLKRLLGETSLERKCRFLFGGGLMVLIMGSFYFYGWLNEDVVYEQNEMTARMLISPILLEKHWTWSETDDTFRPVIGKLASSLKPEGLPEYSWQLMKANLDDAKSVERPADDFGYEALSRLKQGEEKVIRLRTEAVQTDDGEAKDISMYDYYAPVIAKESCLDCHHHSRPGVKTGDMIGMVQISIPLEKTQEALARNNAFLISTALVTAFLAMLAAYAIVRYVIVKPVLHLKDVSDEIARGNLDLRADIQTGDEFEELSHAFNRMLRHLVTVQDELRDVNSNLDGKVDQLAQVNLQLYEMNKLKDEFLATMSHELRTPLNSILGFSDVLGKSENLTDKQTRFLGNIQSSGHDLMAMINDILDLAKIESGKLGLQLLDFTMDDVVHRQVDSLRPVAARKNIELSTELGAEPLEVHSDMGKLQQILNNLLSNAIKFTPAGGRVRVQVERLPDDKYFKLIVEDSGIGIRLEDQATIFEKFRQGRAVLGQEDAMTREFGGTGLGLSIVKELCRLLGGEISVDSEFGKGSTFIIRLPARVQKPESEFQALLNAPLDFTDETAPKPPSDNLEPTNSDEDAA